jgi:hypothetical protein
MLADNLRPTTSALAASLQTSVSVAPASQTHLLKGCFIFCPVPAFRFLPVPMPHLTIEYTANLEVSADNARYHPGGYAAALRHDDGAPLFVAGTRVMVRRLHLQSPTASSDRAFI